MKTTFLASLTLAILSTLLHAAPVTLVTNGKALMPVVISANASGNTVAVAEELAGYLSKISGAKFAVEKGDGSRGIVLGTLAEFPNPALTKPLEIRNTFDGREAFAIHTEKDRVLLFGATDLGASHAAFRLLEHLGCRWFFPAKEWEVVPSTANLSVSLDETDRPRILARRIRHEYRAPTDPDSVRDESVEKDFEALARHNRLGSSFRVPADYTFGSIIDDNQKLFAEHPEYRALEKGEREARQLCLSNPESRRLVIEWALRQLEKHPSREMVSMENLNHLGPCECENCAKSSVSDRVFGLVNEVAKRVPGKMVACFAFQYHGEPPSFRMEPNVYVQLRPNATYTRYSPAPMEERWAALWPKACKNLGFEEFLLGWDDDKLPGGDWANISQTKSKFVRYWKSGAMSLDGKRGNSWAVHGRGYYITDQLLWNPDASVETLLADFYDKAFGPGAAAMRRYYERVAPESEPVMSRGLVGEALRDVEEAARLAKDRPDVQARLDQLKHYLRYVQLRWQYDHEEDMPKRKELTVAMLTLGYRTRHEYMNDWAAMRVTVADLAASLYKEPTWIFKNPAPKPWIVDTPVTKQKTEKWFREGLEYFQPTPVTDLKFSDDLVPVQFADSKPVTRLQSYVGPAYYALHSRTGEPIELEMTPAFFPGYRDRLPARWWLRDRATNIVAEGSMPRDGERRKVTMKVPRAGTYFFDANGEEPGVLAKPDVLITMIKNRGRRDLYINHFQEMFFYVPKGARELQYFWSGYPHTLLGPDGKIIHECSVSDEVVVVTVPAGFDGQCWSLSYRALGHLWLFNAPNCLSASPGTLLLPRELVKKDGLP